MASEEGAGSGGKRNDDAEISGGLAEEEFQGGTEAALGAGEE
jgi:hypothetical protein